MAGTSPAMTFCENNPHPNPLTASGKRSRKPSSDQFKERSALSRSGGNLSPVLPLVGLESVKKNQQVAGT
jgi:hypothetical protein